jgi:hypothetical protein
MGASKRWCYAEVECRRLSISIWVHHQQSAELRKSPEGYLELLGAWAESQGRIGIENHESRKKRHFEETLKAGGSWREAARRELRWDDGGGAVADWRKIRPEGGWLTVTAWREYASPSGRLILWKPWAGNVCVLPFESGSRVIWTEIPWFRLKSKTALQSFKIYLKKNCTWKIL